MAVNFEYFSQLTILKNLENLSDLMIGEKLDIMWGGYARINEHLTYELLKNYIKQGVDFWLMGLNLHHRLLELVRKNIDLASRVLRGRNRNYSQKIRFRKEIKGLTL